MCAAVARHLQIDKEVMDDMERTRSRIAYCLMMDLRQAIYQGVPQDELFLPKNISREQSTNIFGKYMRKFVDRQDFMDWWQPAHILLVEATRLAHEGKEGTIEIVTAVTLGRLDVMDHILQQMGYDPVG